MKIHLNFIRDGSADGCTVTGTVCGRENAQSQDGTNSTALHADVTCALCRKIIADPTHWRHRRYVALTAPTYQPSNLEDMREKLREEIANTGDT